MADAKGHMAAGRLWMSPAICPLASTIGPAIEGSGEPGPGRLPGELRVGGGQGDEHIGRRVEGEDLAVLKLVDPTVEADLVVEPLAAGDRRVGAEVGELD